MLVPITRPDKLICQHYTTLLLLQYSYYITLTTMDCLLPSLINTYGTNNFWKNKRQEPEPHQLEFNRIQDEINNLTQLITLTQEPQQLRQHRKQLKILRLQQDAINRLLESSQEMERKINECYEVMNLPINLIKQSIRASNKQASLSLINDLSDDELEEALSYLNRINADTPKNKTRPIIREAIINKLSDETSYVLK